MNKRINEYPSENFFQNFAEIISILSVVFFIIFSILKRFVENQGFLWIPFVLFACNFLIIVELIYMAKINKCEIPRKDYKNLIGQGVLNFAFVLLIGLIIFDIPSS